MRNEDEKKRSGLTVGVWVHVGDEGVVGAVAGFEEEGHTGNQTKHGALLVGVGKANGDEECAGDDGEEVDEVFLAPHVTFSIDEVGDDAAHRSERDVEQPEHGGPVASAGLAELGEILDVVGAEDGVDG